MKEPAIYIMANKKNGTLYVGVAANLIQRIHQHKSDLIEGFAKKYNCKILVYFELFDNMISTIEREKLIKGGSRLEKIKLIESVNPSWSDLYNSIL